MYLNIKTLQVGTGGRRAVLKSGDKKPRTAITWKGDKFLRLWCDYSLQVNAWKSVQWIWAIGF